jgi:hypothetical protein
MNEMLYADILEKSAEVIEDLLTKVAELQAKISALDGTLGQIKQAADSSVVSDLILKGFSEQEAVTMVNTLPGSALDKVASLSSGVGNDWQMGSASDVPAKGIDPMMDFIFS